MFVIIVFCGKAQVGLTHFNKLTQKGLITQVTNLLIPKKSHTEDFRLSTGYGRSKIGRAVNQMLDFLTRTKIMFFGRSKIGAANWKRQ